MRGSESARGRIETMSKADVYVVGVRVILHKQPAHLDDCHVREATEHHSSKDFQR